MNHFEVHFDEVDGNDAFLKGIVEAHVNLLLEPLVYKYCYNGTVIDPDLIRFDGDVEAEFLERFKAEYMKYTARFALNPPVKKELQEAIPLLTGRVKKIENIDGIDDPDQIKRLFSGDKELTPEETDTIRTFLSKLEVYLGKPMGFYTLSVDAWQNNPGFLEFSGIYIMFGAILIQFPGYVMVLSVGSNL